MKDLSIAMGIHNRNKAKMATGGEVSNEKLHPSHEPHVESIAQKIMDHPDAESIVDSIMEKKAMCDGGMMAGGGEVESTELSESGDNLLSDDPDNPSDTAKDSNMDSDKKKQMADIMASIRSK